MARLVVCIGLSFSRWGGWALSFLGLVFAPSFWEFGLALSSRGVVVGFLEVVFGPTLLGLAFLAVGGGSPVLLEVGGCPFLLGVVLLRVGNWSCLFGVGVGPFFVGV